MVKRRHTLCLVSGHHNKILFTALWVLILTGGCSTSPDRPAVGVPSDYGYTKQYLSWLIPKQMKKHRVTGLSIALVDDQRVVWAQGFGYADKENRVPASPRTLYRVGSISKLFTASAAMQLAERGRLDPDAPLETYLAGFSVRTRYAHAGPITPRQLMTHHSGLPANLAKGMWTQDPAPYAQVLEALKDDDAAYPPDFVFAYSNLGMTVLGQLVAEVSGRSFESYLDENILRPLHMSDSYFSTRPDERALSARGYRKGTREPAPPLRDVPAGGLNSNVLDLARFMNMVFAGGRVGGRQILKPETLAEMLRPQNARVALDLNFHVGLGWVLSGLGGITIENAGTVAHHSGGTPLFHSQLIVLPEHKLGVVVLGNSAGARPAVDTVATEAIKLALEAKTGIRQAKRKRPADAREPLPATALAVYEGDYTTFVGPVKIRQKHGRLRAAALGTKFHLVPREDGRLRLQYKLLGLIPVSLGELDDFGLSRGRVKARDILIARFGGQELLIGERLQPAPVSEAWRRRTGTYVIDNRGQDSYAFDALRLSYDGGFLLAEFSAPPDAGGTIRAVLAPVTDTEAIKYGALQGMGETIRVVTVDGEERLRYSGYLFKPKTTP